MWSQVHVENMHAWLYWSTFNAALPLQARIPDHCRTVLSESIELLEKRTGTPFPKGNNPNVKPILLTLDPVHVFVRPLGWYLFIKSANYFVRKYYEVNYALNYSRFGDLE